MSVYVVSLPIVSSPSSYSLSFSQSVPGVVVESADPLSDGDDDDGSETESKWLHISTVSLLNSLMVSCNGGSNDSNKQAV